MFYKQICRHLNISFHLILSKLFKFKIHYNINTNLFNQLQQVFTFGWTIMTNGFINCDRQFIFVQVL